LKKEVEFSGKTPGNRHPATTPELSQMTRGNRLAAKIPELSGEIWLPVNENLWGLSDALNAYR